MVYDKIMRFLLTLFLIICAQSMSYADEKSLPRFAVLKSDKVNLRQGPTRDHEISMIYQKAGLPVEITGQYDNWLRIRDWEGVEGWVQQSLLTSGKRQVMVAPGRMPLVPLYKNESLSSVLVELEPRVMATAKSCTKKACLIEGVGFTGWIDQNRLWGVYPDERF
jgi:SH3-like domain-containing protein